MQLHVATGMAHDLVLYELLIKNKMWQKCLPVTVWDKPKQLSAAFYTLPYGWLHQSYFTKSHLSHDREWFDTLPFPWVHYAHYSIEQIVIRWNWIFKDMKGFVMSVNDYLMVHVDMKTPYVKIKYCLMQTVVMLLFPTCCLLILWLLMWGYKRWGAVRGKQT